MSLYPNKYEEKGVYEMIDNIGKKLKKLTTSIISYQIKNNDVVVVEFSNGDIKYKAKYNHTGTCEKLKKY